MIVRLDEDGEHDESAALPFRGPLAEQDQKDLRWCLEVCAAQHTTEVDDERDEEALCKELDRESWLIIHAILHGIEDPASLQALLSSEPEG